jgi:hypothetical protein
MRRHEEMLKGGRVSIWIGHMTSEDDLLAYIDDGAFGSDFDFTIDPKFGRELKVEKLSIPLENLVKGFSYWQSFGGAVTEQAKLRGPSSAECMVILYAFEYLPSPRINKNAPLTYFGSFDF